MFSRNNHLSGFHIHFYYLPLKGQVGLVVFRFVLYCVQAVKCKVLFFVKGGGGRYDKVVRGEKSWV